jgi:hypothetical protein
MSRVPLQTESDLQLIKAHILLPMLLDVLERDIRVLEDAKLKLGAVYIGILRGVQDRIIADAAQVRRQMRARGLKVYDEQRTERHVEVRYLCRGYHYRFSLMWGLVKAELGSRLREYLRG